jgi:DNA-binding CsgD family transcriptional regulator
MDPYSTRKIDLLPSPDPTPEDLYIRGLQRRRIEEALARLSPLEKEIIKLRVMEGWTLQRIGKKFGLSRERIRQLEMDAILRAQGKTPVFRKGGKGYKEAAERKKRMLLRQKEAQSDAPEPSPHLVADHSGIGDPWPPIFGGCLDRWNDGRGSGDGEGEEGVG